MKFVEGYEMEKSDEEVISRYCNALNSIKEILERIPPWNPHEPNPDTPIR